MRELFIAWELSGVVGIKIVTPAWRSATLVIVVTGMTLACRFIFDTGILILHVSDVPFHPPRNSVRKLAMKSVWRSRQEDFVSVSHSLIAR